MGLEKIKDAAPRGKREGSWVFDAHKPRAVAASGRGFWQSGGQGSVALEHNVRPLITCTVLGILPPALAPSFNILQLLLLLCEDIAFLFCNPCPTTCDFPVHYIASVEHNSKIVPFHAYQKTRTCVLCMSVLPTRTRTPTNHWLTPETNTTYRNGGHLWRCHCTHRHCGCLRAVPR